MNNNELVSIITPSYNTAPLIEETIKSVQSQTYTNWEMIIVDDCSKDNTDEVVLKYLSDLSIKYIKNEKNSGAAVSRNKALKEAKGRWIAFLDSDDLWEAEKLEKQINFMIEKYCYFSYTSYQEIDENSNPLNRIIKGPRKISKLGMHAYCWIGCLTVMYDRQKVGLIQIEDIKKNNDYAMWLKVCKKENCFFLDENLAKYRKRAGSISRHSVKTMILWHYKLWREAEKKSIIGAAWYTMLNLVCGFYKKMIYVKK